jgi:DNA-binding CsgD family transcriptional regulator
VVRAEAYDRRVPAVIVGRDAELASIRDFVTRIAQGAPVLMLAGEAGMGKTTLWRAGVEAAASAGWRVLRAQPAESETTLSFSGLGDLLDPVLDEALEPLSGAQRSALTRALLLEEVEGPPPDAHAAGVALLNALRGLSGESCVLVAVDDVQWLDAASAAALTYATRRLRAERVGVLLARRTGLKSTLVDDLSRTGRLDEIEVGALDLTCLHEVVQAHLEVALPRPLLAEVHEASGGNPFFALEIVRTLGRSGLSVEAGKPLPVPDSLHDLVHARLLGLPPESRDFLAAAAAHARPNVAITEEASGVDRAVGLPPALEARIVETQGEDIRFTHPLLAAAALETTEATRRAEIHARLADLLEDPEARAWQLAASVTEPDERVADALEDAARHARARGAPRPAALLLERAAELTPEGSEEAAHGRRVEAAYAHHAAGDTARARVLIDRALADARSGRERAGLLVALARVRSYDDDLRGANELYRQAIEEADDGSLIEAYASEGVGGTLFRLRERLAEAVEVSGFAAEGARSLRAPQLEAETLATKAVCEAALGRPEATATAEAALALAAHCADRPLLRQPQFPAAVVRFWHGDLDGARTSFRAMSAAAAELGDESSMPYLHVMLSQIESASGRFQEALREAEEGRVIAELAGQRALIGYALGVRAVAEAHLGREDARVSAEQGLELARLTSGVPSWIFATWAIGHFELANGDPAAAAAALQPLVEHHRREGIRGPGALPFMPDATDALLASGAVGEAADLIDAYAQAAADVGSARAVAVGRRLRGLLLAARGDVDGGLAELEASVESLSAPEDAFDRARSLLALGALQRRAKRRREARATLEQALAEFEDVGAKLWAERARAELKRISGRAATPGALTPAEERVAALVAEGKTNKEVAAALFLSERTVEGHLARIFGKLGVRHRAEIASALTATQTQVVSPSNTGGSPVSAEPAAP